MLKALIEMQRIMRTGYARPEGWVTQTSGRDGTTHVFDDESYLSIYLRRNWLVAYDADHNKLAADYISAAEARAIRETHG